MNSIYLEFKKLTIIGVDKKYQCKFESGLNLIWGDMDSGKSSILNLIDFSLGGGFNDLQLDYDELRAKGRTVLLEVDFNGNVITLERVLASNSNIIKVYSCTSDNIDNTYPKLCSASSKILEPDGWISDVILDLLGIPRVRIKESKLRESADSDRLSFRDLMKLIFLKQKRVASDSLMDAANPIVHNKNIEIQKFIYGVHDDQLSELNQQLKSELDTVSSLKKQADNIRDFLKSTESLSSNDREYEDLQTKIEGLDKEIDVLKSNKNHASIISKSIQGEISRISKDVSILKQDILADKEKLSNYSKLKSTYDYDISCLNSSLKIRGVLSSKDLNKNNVDCPLCHSKVKLSDPALDEKTISYEIRSLRNRRSGCEDAIQKLLNGISEGTKRLEILNEKVASMRLDFDKENIESLSPTIDAISRCETLKQSLVGNYAVLNKNVMLNSKLEEYYSSVENKEMIIGRIRKEIIEIESELDSIDDVLMKLSNEFVLLMNSSKLTNNYGAEIDRKFMPKFRGRLYNHISSGGVRTILSVNLYLSRLRFMLKNGAYLPTTLLLDTPGQNIGRYARAHEQELEQEQEQENLSDPSIYEEIYNQLINIASLAKGRKYQIIVVDNDLPMCLGTDDYHLVKRFDKSDVNYEKGLINDA
ncbi:hypothetical protein TUM4261_33150 [Shewanella sp. c952]|uniref:AAA family ATPase n=1 Tax=Shewanella sp. c952 TaxID=2815913 RepID=UPI001BC3D7EA|nr:AAA family ATPase [Shewanella sp. c952]GIU15710.1 hypothetical protein TUM4261_33150 [Shewanella sp. c952]